MTSLENIRKKGEIIFNYLQCSITFLVSRYCGQVLGNKLAGPILSFSKPFVVRTKTDSSEPHGGVAINNRGYKLTYKQIPCSVERPNAAAFA